eukprot:2002372-Rhodomonas_salina.3
MCIRDSAGSIRAVFDCDPSVGDDGDGWNYLQAWLTQLIGKHSSIGVVGDELVTDLCIEDGAFPLSYLAPA